MNVGDFELIDPVPDFSDSETIAFAMLRPWIDVGRVGTVALNKLQEKLEAKEIGKLVRPGKYFDFTRYRPRAQVKNGQRVLNIPNTYVHHSYDATLKKNLLFLHIREPHQNAEEYVDSILALFKFANVSEFVRIGGMYDSVPHTRPILVTGSMKPEQEQAASDVLKARKSTYQGPTSILNLVNQHFSENNIPNSTLMAHLPQYVQLDRDHLGAARLLEVLCAVYGFSEEIINKDFGVQQYKDIDKSIDYTGEVGTLIKQLETYYDRVLSKTESDEKDDAETSSVNLSADVEDFLNQMGEKFENDPE